MVLDEFTQVYGLWHLFGDRYAVKICSNLRCDEEGKTGVGCSVYEIDEFIDDFFNGVECIFLTNYLFVSMRSEEAWRVADAIEDENGLPILESQGNFIPHTDTWEGTLDNHKIAVLDPAFQFFVEFEPFLTGFHVNLWFSDIEDVLGLDDIAFGFQQADDFSIV